MAGKADEAETVLNADAGAAQVFRHPSQRQTCLFQGGPRWCLPGRTGDAVEGLWVAVMAQQAGGRLDDEARALHACAPSACYKEGKLCSGARQRQLRAAAFAPATWGAACRAGKRF